MSPGMWPYESLNFLGDRPAVIYALQAARGPTMVFNGLGDTAVAIPTHGENFFEDLRARAVQLCMAGRMIFSNLDLRRRVAGTGLIG